MERVTAQTDAQPIRHLALLWLLCAGLLAAAAVLDATEPGGRGVFKIAGTDSVCYFALGHSMVFDRDFDLSNQFAALPLLATEFTDRRPETGLPGCPYALGYPLVNSPFLALGALLDRLTGGAGDGYGAWAVRGWFAGTLVWLAVGLSALFAALRRLVGERTAFETTLLLLFGSTLLYYTVSPMAHAASFVACSLFLLAWLRARELDSPAAWAALGLAAGLAAATRWQEALLAVVALPDLFCRGLGWRRLVAVPCALLVLAPQLWQWQRVYGSMAVLPQGPGFLAWPPRHAWDVLWSTNHGWFIWTPLLLAAVAGLFLGLRRWPGVCGPLLVVIALQVLVVGSMPTNWHGKDGFGQRLLTGSVALTAPGLALLLEPKGLARRLVAWLLVLFAVAFAAQYRLDLIPRRGELTFEQVVTDKLRPDRAWRRRAGRLAAERALDAGESERAKQRARETLERYGYDARLERLLTLEE